ncbi:MAG: protein-methionine-sulfoxide reductase catalytic subunit MsrP [Acidobacteria bacterium]|nr:protein-methionine-sulfoxide reductase catalytic subunit MsrP [Acidobacteriota bacterium]
MLVKKAAEIRSSEITPKSIYMNRRRFLADAAVTGAVLFAGRALWPTAFSPAEAWAGTKLAGITKSSFSTDEKLTPLNDVTHYNNFYEFGTDKEQPAGLAKDFRTTPWTVSVEGEVQKPAVYDLDQIMKLAPLEERIYRLRCVEGWSMVVPWIGFPLNVLIKLVAPTSKAKFVAFQTFYDPKQMLSSRSAGIPFPYVEGLRMDEAMHPLTILCVGLYGEVLPNQNGAPLRLVVPWKYGFKSIKSIVKIRFQERQPPTTWSMANSREYGFYSNVNPNVDHPRWSQGRERRLGEFFKRKTLPFNGYAEQVASLYAGMDLRKFF